MSMEAKIRAIKKYRPGNGWTQLSPSVYEHSNGARIHLACAMLTLPGQFFIVGDKWPESQVLAWFVRVNGANRKRGIMAWAKWRATSCKD